MVELIISDKFALKSDSNNQIFELINIIADSSPEGIILANHNNEIIYINKLAKKFLGSLYSNESGTIITLPIKINSKSKLKIKLNPEKIRNLEIFASKYEINGISGLLIKIREININVCHTGGTKTDEYSDFYKRSDIARYKYDFQTNEFDFYNCGFENLIGKERINSKKSLNIFKDYIFPEDYFNIENILDEFADNNNRTTYHKEQWQYRIIDTKGKLVWIDDFVTIHIENREIISIEGVAFIINDLKESNIKLTNTEKLFNHILAATFDGVFDHNLITDKINFNDNWFKMLGYDRDEIEPLDVYLHQLVHPDDLERIFKALADHINNDTIQYAVIYRIQAKNGEWKWILSRGKVVEFDETGKPSRVVGTHINISHYKTIEIIHERSHFILQNLIDNINEALTIFSEQAKIVEWNKKAEQITGIKNENAVGKYIWEVQRLLMRDVDKEKTSFEIHKITNLENIRKIKNNENVNYVSTIYKQDGSKKILETCLFPIALPDGDFLGGGLMRDITGFKLLSDDFSELDQRFNIIFENLSEVIYKRDFNLNKFDFISPNIERILGYKPDEIFKRKDKDILELIHPDDRALFENCHFTIPKDIQSVSLWRKYEVEYRLMNISGKYLPIKDTYQVLYDSLGNPLVSVGTLNNIAEKKTLDLEINDSQDKYKFIVENQSEFILKLDEKLICRYVSPSYCTLFDISENKVLDKKINFEKYPNDKGVSKSAFFSIFKNESDIGKFDCRMETKYGWLWISWALKLVKTDNSQLSIVCVGRDITKQKRIEETLKLSEKNYRGLFEYAFDVIIVFNPENEIILDANQSACELYGCKKDEFIGKSLVEYTIDVEHGKSQIEATIQKQENHRFRTKHRNKSGDVFNLDITSSLIQFDNKQVILSIGRQVNE
jgi:PAS domain S-box-containing protein